MADQIRKVMYCPHCGNRAPQRLIHKQTYIVRGWYLDKAFEEECCWSTFVAVCETCDHVLLYDNPKNLRPEEEFDLCYLEYPISEALHTAVPKPIAKIYAEAHPLRSSAPRAFILLIRTALEAICKDRGIINGRLQEKLKTLSEKGEIPPVLAQATDVLRKLGNIGAHDADEYIHPVLAFAVDDFFRAIIEYLYIAPAKLERYEKIRKVFSTNGRAV